MTENEKQNKDILGTKWILAPGGREIVNRCQVGAWDASLEIRALASLFRNLQSCEVKEDELYGMGLILERIARKLSKISDHMGKVVSKGKD